jgi:hypothetical protein
MTAVKLTKQHTILQNHYKCMAKSMTTRWNDIKLTPGNEVLPFTGVPYAFGTAHVSIIGRNLNGCRTAPTYRACISTDIEGFVPKALHIHKGPINGNGNVVVDFTPLLKNNGYFSDCVQITTKELYTNLIAEPVSIFFDKYLCDRPSSGREHVALMSLFALCWCIAQDQYYVNAHLGGDAPTILQSIRGQFVQGFSASLQNSQTIAPFNVTTARASGMAKITFEDAGQVACFDVTIMNFAPALGHVHNATRGTNGPRIMNYTDLNIGPGRFFGCKSIMALNITIDTVAMILRSPKMFYFDYHLSGVEPGLFRSIRGQFETMY